MADPVVDFSKPSAAGALRSVPKGRWGDSSGQETWRNGGGGAGAGTKEGWRERERERAGDDLEGRARGGDRDRRDARGSDARVADRPRDRRNNRNNGACMCGWGG